MRVEKEALQYCPICSPKVCPLGCFHSQPLKALDEIRTLKKGISQERIEAFHAGYEGGRELTNKEFSLFEESIYKLRAVVTVNEIELDIDPFMFLSALVFKNTRPDMRNAREMNNEFFYFMGIKFKRKMP